MAAIQTTLNRVGNFLKHEYRPDLGFCRETAPVTVSTLADNANGGKGEVGEIVIKIGAAANFVKFDAQTVSAADTIAIVVDDQVEEFTPAGGNVSLALLVRGAAQIREGGLIFGDDNSNWEDAKAKLSALDVQFIDSLSVSHQG